MLIDWFTVFAQIVNFLVLILLLRYFLYGRIVNAMKQREESIASQIQEAEKYKTDAAKEAEDLQKKNRELDEKKAGMLLTMKEEVETRHSELMEEARSDVDRVHARWLEAIQRQKYAFLQDLRRRSSKELYAIARRTLKDLARADLEEQIVDIFIERITEVGGESEKQFAGALAGADRKVSVKSSFEITEETRQRIEKALNDKFKNGFELTYKTSTDVVMGIELNAAGYKIAWSIDDYLDSLEASISEAMEQEARDDFKAKTEEASEQEETDIKPKQESADINNEQQE